MEQIDEESQPFCCRCKEDFPIHQFPDGKFESWRMGILRDLIQLLVILNPD